MGTNRIQRARLVLVALVACLSPLFALSAAADELDLRLKGVSMSRSGPMALIDHRVVAPGDTIGEVEIREIRKFSVIVRSEGRDYVLRLGSDGRPQPYAAVAPPSADPIAPVAAPGPRMPTVAAGTPSELYAEQAAPVTPEPEASTERALRASPERRPVEDRISRASRPPSSTRSLPKRSRFHRVARGETLSGIVADHYGAAFPLTGQAMIALYEGHPEAFGADMNVLFEGARLRMPDENTLSTIDAGGVKREVERQVARWRRRVEDPEIVEVERPSDVRFLPVVAGETLSGIARRERPPDVTLEQMMLVVYDANPHAFGGNINLLFAGATLRIPSTGSTEPPSPEHAAAEVRRQMARWQERDAQIEESTEVTPFASRSLSSQERDVPRAASRSRSRTLVSI